MTEIPKGSYNNALGMYSNLLRKYGFKRVKGKDLFVRHTVGIGGVYVRPVNDRWVMEIMEYREQKIFHSVSSMEAELKRLEDTDFNEKIKWMNKIKEYGS